MRFSDYENQNEDVSQETRRRDMHFLTQTLSYTTEAKHRNIVVLHFACLYSLHGYDVTWRCYRPR